MQVRHSHSSIMDRVCGAIVCGLLILVCAAASLISGIGLFSKPFESVAGLKQLISTQQDDADDIIYLTRLFKVSYFIGVLIAFFILGFLGIIAAFGSCLCGTVYKPMPRAGMAVSALLLLSFSEFAALAVLKWDLTVMAVLGIVGWILVPLFAISYLLHLCRAWRGKAPGNMSIHRAAFRHITMTLDVAVTILATYALVENNQLLYIRYGSNWSGDAALIGTAVALIFQSLVGFIWRLLSLLRRLSPEKINPGYKYVDLVMILLWIGLDVAAACVTYILTPHSFLFIAAGIAAVRAFNLELFDIIVCCTKKRPPAVQREEIYHIPEKQVLHILPRGDEEYTKVEQLFEATMDKATIHSVQRVDCPNLVKNFRESHIYMFQTRINERQLFHPASASSIDTICKGNFSREEGGFGEGIYFYRDADGYHRRVRRETNGLLYMFVANVYIGSYTVGQPGYQHPPKLSRGILHDSCVDNIDYPTIFVVFNDSHCYPQYLITYSTS